VLYLSFIEEFDRSVCSVPLSSDLLNNRFPALTSGCCWVLFMTLQITKYVWKNDQCKNVLTITSNLFPGICVEACLIQRMNFSDALIFITIFLNFTIRRKMRTRKNSNS